MRTLLTILMLSAAGKVLIQHYLASNAKDEIIVQTYKARAAGACTRAAKAQQITTNYTWSDAAAIRLVIGKNTADVQIWQYDHALWSSRFKNPYLILSVPGETPSMFCEFDIVQNAASIFRM